MLTEISQYTPAVFAVGDEYQIMLPVKTSCTFWVKVGEQYFYDDSNGTMRSDTDIHRVRVPMELLNQVKKYSVGYQIVIERKPYFSVMGDVCEEEFSFRPVPKDNVKIYQIADAHGIDTAPIEAALAFAKAQDGLDLLILNGDVLDHSGSISNFMIVYEIATRVTKGEIPMVVSRGNHDLRGVCAEKLAQYTPNENGNTYYTFRIGNLWGLVLDCGEDKEDGHPEYAGTVRCHSFRQRETEYLKKVIANAEKEYNAPGVEYRMILSHVPFTYIDKVPFDIEQDTYGGWVKLINENIKPDCMLCGHVHEMSIDMPGSKRDSFGAEFPVIVGSKLIYAEKYFAGCGLVTGKNGTKVVFNDKDQILKEEWLK